jgi:predicted DNA-binding helix-hairpin-helix protein
LVDEQHPNLDQEVDPKLGYALRHPELFPVDVNTASYELILRVPGIGVKSAKKIVQARRFGKLRAEHLQKIGIVWKRARYFLITAEPDFRWLGFDPNHLKQRILSERSPKYSPQLALFG